MKKFLVAAFTTVMLMANSVYAYENATVFVNGQQISDGVLVNGRTLVPLRVIAEAMGCEVAWDPSSKTATITDSIGDRSSFSVRIFSMTVGSNQLTMKIYSPVHTTPHNYFDAYDTVETMDCAPIIENGKIMVPLRVISDHFNVPVQWDGSTKTVTIGGSGVVREPETYRVDSTETEEVIIDMSGQNYEIMHSMELSK